MRNSPYETRKETSEAESIEGNETKFFLVGGFWADRGMQSAVDGISACI